MLLDECRQVLVPGNQLPYGSLETPLIHAPTLPTTPDTYGDAASR
jgi:hypothetical protein